MAIRPSNARPRRSADLAAWLVVAAAALICAFPIYWMVVTAITPLADLRSDGYALWPTAFRWHSFVDSWHKFPFASWYLNSTLIALVGVIGTVSINLLGGYTFAKLRFPGRDALFLLISRSARKQAASETPRSRRR